MPDFWEIGNWEGQSLDCSRPYDGNRDGIPRADNLSVLVQT